MCFRCLVSAFVFLDCKYWKCQSVPWSTAALSWCRSLGSDLEPCAVWAAGAPRRAFLPVASPANANTGAQLPESQTNKQLLCRVSPRPLLSWDSILAGHSSGRGSEGKILGNVCFYSTHKMSSLNSRNLLPSVRLDWPCTRLCNGQTAYLHLGLKSQVRLRRRQGRTQVPWLQAFIASPLPLLSWFPSSWGFCFIFVIFFGFVSFLALFKSLREKVCKKNKQTKPAVLQK